MISEQWRTESFLKGRPYDHNQTCLMENIIKWLEKKYIIKWLEKKKQSTQMVTRSLAL